MPVVTWKIPGIRSIHFVDAATLPCDCDALARVGMPLVLAVDDPGQQLFDEPECTVTETHTRAGVKYDARLTFVTDSMPRVITDAGVVVVTHDGDAFLLGRREAPYPRISVSRSTGHRRDRRALSVEVTCITRPAECSVAMHVL